MKIAAAAVPLPVRTARAAAPAPAAAPQAVKAVAPTVSEWAIWSAGATLAAGVILGVLGRPVMAVACVASALVDGAVALIARK